MRSRSPARNVERHGVSNAGFAWAACSHAVSTAEMHNGQTLDDVLDQIDTSDAD